MNVTVPGRRVFIIMPVGSDPEHSERSSAIRRGLRRAGYQPVFPFYDASDPQFSLREFRTELHTMVAVLADLSGERPSCYYELGVAEAFACPVRLFAKIGTAIHQSGHRDYLQFYDGFIELEQSVTMAFSALLEDEAARSA